MPDMIDQSAVVVLEPVADVCLRLANDRAFDIQPSVRAALRMAHDALKAYETADATLYAAAPKPTLSGEGDESMTDLRWAVYAAAYAILRDYENHPTKDRGLINAGDRRIPLMIADQVEAHLAALSSPLPGEE